MLRLIAAFLHILGVTVLGAGTAVGITAFGVLVAPELGLTAVPATSAPRRPPVIPPAVPLGAPEHLAQWSYVEKVNQAWERDWPTVIVLLEELLSRYPTNPVANEALYAAYVEHGKQLRDAGDRERARARFERATEHAPERGEAFVFLDELDKTR